jgi:hypothetical protein
MGGGPPGWEMGRVLRRLALGRGDARRFVENDGIQMWMDSDRSGQTSPPQRANRKQHERNRSVTFLKVSLAGRGIYNLGLASCSHIFQYLYLALAAQEWSLQESIRARRPLLGRRYSHHFRSVSLFSVRSQFSQSPPEKAGTHSEKLYEYCSTNDSDVQVAKRLDVRRVLFPSPSAHTPRCSGTETGIPAVQPTLEARSSSTPASWYRLQDRTRMTRMMAMATATERVQMRSRRPSVHQRN